jgi:hypothetical protein
MAQSVFITQDPTILNVSKNPMVFVLSSSNIANPQYQYVVDVRTQPDNILRGRIKQYPNPDGKAVFDASHIIDDYLEPDTSNFTNTTIQSVSGSEFQFFQVTAGEEFGTSPSSSVILYDGVGAVGSPAATGSAPNGLYGAWGGAMDVTPGNTSTNGGWNFGDYFGTSSMSYILSSFTSTDTFASQYNHKMGPNDYGLMPIMDTNNLITTNNTTVSLYNSNGVVFNSKIFPRTLASQYVNYIPCGTQNFLDYGVFQQSDINATAWYKIQTTGTNVFTKTFTLQHCSHTFERLNFMFINKWGLWENYGLNQPLKKSTTISREEITRSRIPYSSTTADASYGQRGGDYYNSSFEDRFSISTPYVTDKEAGFISQLIESPQVYLQQNNLDMGLGVNLSTPTFVPVQITNSSYVSKTNKLQKIFKYDIEYKLSNQRPAR